MKKLLLTVGLALWIAPQAALAAGVSSISEADITTDGNQAYKIVCTNGQEFRIWWSGGEWKDGWGAQGGQNRNLEEQAEYLCD